MNYAHIRYSSYSLKYLPVLDENNEGVLAIPNGMTATFQSGFRLAMLNMQFECDCCDFILERNWFFQLKDSDYIVKRMNINVLNDSFIALDLPCSTRGMFIHNTTDSSKHGFSDAYILRNLVLCNNDENFQTIFGALNEELKCRCAFIMIKRNAHRKSVEAHRIAVLHMLSKKHINEVGIRASIVKRADLW